MFKLNGGKGAIVCNECSKGIAEGVKPTVRNQSYILCKDCKRKKHEKYLTMLDKDIDSLVKEVGMQRILERLITNVHEGVSEEIQAGKDAGYLKLLENDLKHVLKNYKERYKE